VRGEYGEGETRPQGGGGLECREGERGGGGGGGDSGFKGKKRKKRER
jgi:hypothetical protein